MVFFLYKLSYQALIFFTSSVIRPLSDIPFTNLFSQFGGCLFILVIDTFCYGEAFQFYKYHFFLFAFGPCLFGFMSKKSLPELRSRRFSFRFSPRGFVVWGFTSKVLIHFLQLLHISIQVELSDNVVPMSAVQQSDSIIHIYSFFFIFFFHHGLSQEMGQSSLWSMV